MAEKKLVIVESPSKAKTISKFLGKNYAVIASQGHVIDLPKSQLGIDVGQDVQMKYITIRGKGPILAQIKKEAKSASRVYLATDPDREGEAISWHLANFLGLNTSSKCRIEFHEITKDTIKNAIKNPRTIDMNKVDAQQARRALDRLVGYGISPLLWAKIKKGLSAGRVQSVATRLVVERDAEIENFIPEEFWDVLVEVSNGKFSLALKLLEIDGKKAKITSSQQAQAIENRILSSSLQVETIKNGEKKRNALPPFITSTLQQAASNRLNFSTAKTMQVVQQLYEGINIGKQGTVGLVTYIRTDSVRVSDEALQSVRQLIGQQYGANYLPTSPNFYKGRKNAQDAHEAIRPTSMQNTPESIKDYLTKDQYKLYTLIFNRFVASQMANAVYDTKNISATAEGLKFGVGYEILKFDGFMKLYATDDVSTKANKSIEQFSVGQKLSVKEVQKKQHFTEPKPHFTEATLVKELEERGIGRPSTYAPTISTVIARGYISKESKQLFATELGILVTHLLTEHFKDVFEYDFTANMEDALDGVEEGKEQWKNLILGFYPSFEHELHQAEQSIEKVEIKDELSNEICEKCGRTMVYKMSKYGKFLACPGFPECSNTKTIVEYIDASCPLCGGHLLKKTSRKRRKTFYGCENYPTCQFTSWDKPSTKICEKCGSFMVEKNTKTKKVYLCSNKSCLHKVEENHD